MSTGYQSQLFVWMVRQPGFGCQALGFKRFDLVALAQRQADVVQSVKQAVLAKHFHREGDFFALRLHNHLPL